MSDSPSIKPLRVAIIGGGFCGAMTAVHLLAAASAARPMLIALIDPSELTARGVAYGTTRREHLLNVEAGRMGAYHDDVEGFLRWMRRRDASVSYHDYRSRCDYGEYVQELFEQARGKTLAADLSHARTRAIAIEPPIGVSGPVVQLSNGEQVNCDVVVLASGHARPATPGFVPPHVRDDPTRYVSNPWNSGVFDRIDRDAPLLIIGTGLTMIDVFTTLRSLGHRGVITALSRHGWLPQRHASLSTRRAAWIDRSRVASVREVVRQIRARISSAAERGETWREAIDGVRIDASWIWARWSIDERRRFLRHARALWDVHRHRVASQLANEIDAAITSGRLRTIAGRVTSVEAIATGLRVALRPRGGDGMVKPIEVATMINCTGPQSDVLRVDDPLVQSLLARGLVKPDELGLGIETDEFGYVQDAAGRTQPWLLTLGTLRRSTLWESIAVPELRVQARETAAAILAMRR